MRPIQILRENPLILLGIAVAAFLAWLASDYTQLQTSPEKPAISQTKRSIAATELVSTDIQTRSPGPSVVTADHVPQLKAGMTRTEVEAIIGPPPASMVSPVSESEGRMTYKAAYLANLDPGPAPIRGPVPVSRYVPPPPTSLPKSLIALEYDATKPGHPLLNVEVQTPKF